MINDGDRKFIDQSSVSIVFRFTEHYLVTREFYVRKENFLSDFTWSMTWLVLEGSASLMVKVAPPSFIFLSSVLRVIRIC